MYGDRLRLLRKAKQLTMEEVGLRLGIAKSSYAGYETEARQPPLDKLQKLALMYDVSVDYILGLTDDPDPKKERKELKDILNKQDLMWKGQPVSEEDLKLVSEILERVVVTQLPQYLKDKNEFRDKSNTKKPNN